jgi:hypothetical protein
VGLSVAYKVIKKGNITANPSQTDYIADEPADIFELPTDISWGATCFVISTSSVYMLNSKGEWKEI